MPPDAPFRETTNERVNRELRAEGLALCRVARELRDFLRGINEPEAQSLLLDVDTVERVGSWLQTNSAVTFSGGISVRDSEAR
jgi:hypothetical protein